MADGPQVRIGDRERDEAVRLLREHLAAGRIDYTEFEERMAWALQARTEPDLLTLFADLPGVKPVGRPLAAPRPEQSLTPLTPQQVPGRLVAYRMLAPMAMLLPALVVLLILTGGVHWALFAPLLVFALFSRSTYAVQRVRHTPPGPPYR
ncbi:MAG: DUF1707 SHOCT-like domain-containing protein [Propionibacteriaceae bacterium]